MAGRHVIAYNSSQYSGTMIVEPTRRPYLSAMRFSAMQRKFERRAAAVLAVLALTCPGVGLAQTSTVAAPPQPQNPDAIVAQMAAQLPPPVTAPIVTSPVPPAGQGQIKVIARVGKAVACAKAVGSAVLTAAPRLPKTN